MRKTLAAISSFVVFILILLVFFHGCKRAGKTHVATQEQQEKLSEAVYKIDTETFLKNLKQLAGAKDGESNVEMLRRYFNRNGVEIKSPEAIFLDDKSGRLFISVSKSHRDKAERLVMAVQNNIQPSKIYN